MHDLGTILREAREAKGISLQGMEQITRIRVRFLEALEDGEYHVLPTPAHVRGFLRNYAVALGLDPEPLLSRYDTWKQIQDKRMTPRQARQTSSQSPESTVPAVRPPSTAISPDLFFGVLLTVGIIILVLWGLTRILNDSARTNTPPTPTAQAMNQPGIVLQVVHQAGEESHTPIPAAMVFTPTAPISASAHLTTMATGQPGPVDVSVRLVERAWLKVVVDGSAVYQGMAAPGWSQSWQGTRAIQVVTGNGAGVVVTVNGIVVGPLGQYSQVVDRTWAAGGPSPQPLTEDQSITRGTH